MAIDFVCLKQRENLETPVGTVVNKVGFLHQNQSNPELDQIRVRMSLRVRAKKDIFLELFPLHLNEFRSHRRNAQNYTVVYSLSIGRIIL